MCTLPQYGVTPLTSFLLPEHQHSLLKRPFLLDLDDLYYHEDQVDNIHYFPKCIHNDRGSEQGHAPPQERWPRLGNQHYLKVDGITLVLADDEILDYDVVVCTNHMLLFQDLNVHLHNPIQKRLVAFLVRQFQNHPNCVLQDFCQQSPKQTSQIHLMKYFLNLRQTYLHVHDLDDRTLRKHDYQVLVESFPFLLFAWLLFFLPSPSLSVVYHVFFWFAFF